jgi:very-short-patch-repair endonuclease
VRGTHKFPPPERGRARFFVDFCCLSESLVVEVDGYFHTLEATAQKDKARTAWLTTQGYRVLRVAEADVRNRLEAVLTAIAAAARPPSLALPPTGGGKW